MSRNIRLLRINFRENKKVFLSVFFIYLGLTVVSLVAGLILFNIDLNSNINDFSISNRFNYNDMLRFLSMISTSYQFSKFVSVIIGWALISMFVIFTTYKRFMATEGYIYNIFQLPVKKIIHLVSIFLEGFLLFTLFKIVDLITIVIDIKIVEVLISKSKFFWVTMYDRLSYKQVFLELFGFGERLKYTAINFGYYFVLSTAIVIGLTMLFTLLYIRFGSKIFWSVPIYFIVRIVFINRLQFERPILSDLFIYRIEYNSFSINQYFMSVVVLALLVLADRYLIINNDL